MAGFAGIATKKLTDENYENWKECLKSYFIANDLWDVVNGVESEQNYKEWVRKNAMALHAIQISCKGDTMLKLRGNETTNYWWNVLAKKTGIKSPIESVEIMQLEENKCSNLFKDVERGNWARTRTFLEESTDAIRQNITLLGENVLHLAVISKQTKILGNLLEYLTEEDLEVKNEMGYTAFTIAAIHGLKDMVEIMLRKKSNLVILKDGDGLIPIVRASFYSSREMVRYLYTKTPPYMLSPENPDRSGATLLNCLISDELYDVASHLLEKYPRGIRLLARKRFGFPSGNRDSFWEHWLYSCISVTVPPYDEHLQSSDEESNVQLGISHIQ